jgi:hypothetical protein
MPMAKIPSSIIANQLENFGGGLVSGALEFKKGWSELKDLKDSGKESTPAGVSAVFKMRNGIQTVIRTSGVMLAAYFITQGMNKKDKDFKSDQYGNYYVHINGYWVSTQAFGPAAIAVDGALEAKTGHGGVIWDYPVTGLKGVLQSPVVSDYTSTVQNVTKQKNIVSGLGAATQNFYNPIVAQDIEKATKEKSLNPIFFGSMIRTDKQMKQEAIINQRKSQKALIQNKKNARKPQTFFGQ